MLLTQMKLNEELDMGYAIDIYSNLSSQRNFVSHEIMLNYKFKFRKSGIVTPRYF